MEVITFTRQNSDGLYQAGFKIGNQTFFLQPCNGEEFHSSEKQAEWYRHQLHTAFNPEKIKCYKIESDRGHYFAMAPEIDESMFEDSKSGDYVTVTLCEMTQHEFNELPEFSGF